MITSKMRQELFEKAGWLCEICGAPLASGQPQLAHRVPKTKTNLKRYGEDVIDHPLNLCPVESLRCNSSAIIHGAEERALVRRIRRHLDDDL